MRGCFENRKIMLNSEKCKLALSFATEKHEGQTRRGGIPYITHPIAVAEMMEKKGLGEEYILVGLFHDLLEDTDATDDEILAIGGREVLLAVQLLTKENGYVMSEYIDGIKKNPIAREVKAADRIHNLSCATVCSEEFKLRYIKESIDWYLDFSPEVAVVTRNLISTLASPDALPEEYYAKLKKFE